MSNSGMVGKALLHFAKRNRVFLAPFGNYSQVMKVFEQALVFVDGQDNSFLFAGATGDVLRLRRLHDVSPFIFTTPCADVRPL
jgi:hypothetical protein